MALRQIEFDKIYEKARGQQVKISPAVSVKDTVSDNVPAWYDSTHDNTMVRETLSPLYFEKKIGKSSSFEQIYRVVKNEVEKEYRIRRPKVKSEYDINQYENKGRTVPYLPYHIENQGLYYAPGTKGDVGRFAENTVKKAGRALKQNAAKTILPHQLPDVVNYQGIHNFEKAKAAAGRLGKPKELLQEAERTVKFANNFIDSVSLNTTGGIITAAQAAAQTVSGATGKARKRFLEENLNPRLGIDGGKNTKKFLYDWQKAKQTERLDENALGYQLLQQADELTKELIKDMTPKEQFATQTLMSVLQNAELMPLAILNPALATGALSLSAAGRSMYNSAMDGKNLSDAFTKGVIDGSIEYATEKIGVDSWLELIAGKGGGVIKNLLRQAGSEAGEEALVYIAAYLTDIARKEPDARFSPQELRQNMLAGGLSGGILGGGAAAVGGAFNSNSIPSTEFVWTNSQEKFTQKQNSTIAPANNITYNTVEGGVTNEKVQNTRWPGWGEIYSGGNVADSTESVRRNGATGGESRTDTRRSRKIPLEDSRGNRIDRSIGERIAGTAIAENDKPIKVYHFTQNMDFDIFGEGDIGFHLGTEEQAIQRKNDLKAEEGRMIKAYLNIKNPLYIGKDIMNTKADALALKLYSMDILTREQWQSIFKIVKETQDSSYSSKASKQLREILREKGIDGFIYDNLYEGKGKSYIALYPEQILIVDDGKRYNDTKKETGIIKTGVTAQGGVTGEPVSDSIVAYDNKNMQAAQDISENNADMDSYVISAEQKEGINEIREYAEVTGGEIKSAGFDMYGDILLEIEEDGKTFYAAVSPSGKTNYSHKGGRIVESIGLEGNDSKNKAVEKSTSAGDIYKVYAENIDVKRLGNSVMNMQGLKSIYADSDSIITKRKGQTEFYRHKNYSHRKLNKKGQQIIDKATYNVLTRDFIAGGGIIIRGKDAENHLGEECSASYMPSFNAAFIRDDATVSDVLEEMYHAKQDKIKMFGEYATDIVIIKREIAAQKYLIKVAEKYKVPIEETMITIRNLKHYEAKLKIYESEGKD